MEYVQERIATLHDFGRRRRATGRATDSTTHPADDTSEPPTRPASGAPLDRTTVIVPLTDRDRATPAAEHTFAALSRTNLTRVVVALRAPAGSVAATREWLAGFDLPVELVWCGGPRLEATLHEAGLDGAVGKGRDVWLGLGMASDAPLIVVHDADARTFSPARVARLCAPLAEDFPGGGGDDRRPHDTRGGYDFVKGYYARIERNRLYGRLFRLFYTPLVCALDERHDAKVLRYLGSFRYALAGEFALTGALARSLRLQRGWGLEVGTLGEAFREVGFKHTVQVDLGTHAHDHRSVSAPTGLAEMSQGVGAALFRAIEECGVEPDYDTLSGRYRETARALIRQYAADAAMNGLDYDPDAERDQIEAYARAISPPGPDTRLPAWDDAPVTPDEIRNAARADLDSLDG